MKSMRAFTLLELLIALGIVGILMAFAYPSYRDYIMRAARSDAYIGVKNMAGLMEKQYAVQNRYEEIPAMQSPEGYYSIRGVTGIAAETECNTATSDTSATFAYTILATPIAGRSQASDDECSCLLLTSNGVKGSIDSNGAPADCW